MPDAPLGLMLFQLVVAYRLLRFMFKSEDCANSDARLTVSTLPLHHPT